MPVPILEAIDLTKMYGRTTALVGFNIAVMPGEVVGLLGPNGSGKTTALRSVLGFLKPTRGTVKLAGFDCWSQSVQARRHVAYLPGELRLYENMTGRQLVRFLHQLRGGAIHDVDRLARTLDIDPDLPLTRLSSGMKRKVALLAVLTPQVPLLLLDEPTNTLDPTMRDEFLTQIRRAKAEGQAVLFSSHVLQEVEAVCDRVVILRKGSLVHEQSLPELQAARHVRARLLGLAPTHAPENATMTITGTTLDVQYHGADAQLLDWLRTQHITDLRIEPLGLGPIYHRFHPSASR